ncbi:UNVERIFIED_CONTAM: Mitochondrial inner membrane protein COX18 [Trichonephila clavipes]
MNVVYLINTVNFKKFRTLSSLQSRWYHQFNYRNPHPKCIISRISPGTVIFSRHFSYVEFYTGVAQSTPVVSFQNTLIDLHQFTGLPWWALIMLTTLSIRSAIVFPLAIHQNQVIARLANINVEIGKLAPELNKEVNIAKVMFKWNETEAKKVFRKQLRAIHHGFVIRDNCHPFKTVLLGLLQIPVWIIFSISLRNLTFMSQGIDPVSESIAGLKTEGLLWFPDLTSPDHIIIPVLLLFVNLAVTEIHALRNIGKGSLPQKILLNTSRAIIVVIAAAATINPSSVSFYWLCSSAFGLGQNMLLMIPNVRRILGIPSTAKESSTPFRDIAANFRKRFNR